MSQGSLPSGRLYMDALGDPGRSQGSQPAYAVCTVWVGHTEAELESIFAQVRSDLGLRAGYEFHAAQLTPSNWKAKVPERFFDLLVAHGLNAECWCAEVQKSKSSLPLHIAGKALTHELMAQTIARMPPNRVAGHTLIIDEEAKGKKVPKVVSDMHAGVKAALARRGMEYTLAKLSARPAHQKAGLQLADFLAAALVHPWPSCMKALSGWRIDHWRT